MPYTLRDNRTAELLKLQYNDYSTKLKFNLHQGKKGVFVCLTLRPKSKCVNGLENILKMINFLYTKYCQEDSGNILKNYFNSFAFEHT